MTTTIVPLILKRQPSVPFDEHGEPWFVASDIARSLESARCASDMTRSSDDDEQTQIVRTLGDQERWSSTNRTFSADSQKVTRMKPSASNVGDREVLPTIRKTGSYAVPGALAALPHRPTTAYPRSC